MSAAGMPDGEYAIGDLPVVMKGGEARLKDGNALAGSCLTMSGALRYVLANTTLTVPEVSRLASGNAAKQLGTYDRTGSIAVGKQADLVLLDGQFHVQNTWVRGRSVYEKQS
ncbi:N-acetylglucosamine-6-phosphate deacetylase [compost metagenome]